MHGLDAPAALDELLREKVEQLRMSRSRTANAEIRRSLDQPASEMMLPNAIDHYTRGEWILRISDPISQLSPATFVLARAYLDQLQRSGGLSPARLTAVRGELSRIEGLGAAQRGAPLTQLATQLNSEAASSSDQAKVRLLATAVRDLAAVR